MNRTDSFSTCARIRESATRLDAPTKGKKCPGGYWIAKNKKCGKGKMGSPMSKGMAKNLAIGAGGAALGGLAAGGAAMAAYQNREGIIKGVDETGKGLRKSTRDVYEGVAKDPKSSPEDVAAAREALRTMSKSTAAASKTAREAAKAGEGIERRVTRRAGRVARVVGEKVERAARGVGLGSLVDKAKETFAKQPEKDRPKQYFPGTASTVEANKAKPKAKSNRSGPKK